MLHRNYRSRLQGLGRSVPLLCTFLLGSGCCSGQPADTEATGPERRPEVDVGAKCMKRLKNLYLDLHRFKAEEGRFPKTLGELTEFFKGQGVSLGWNCRRARREFTYVPPENWASKAELKTRKGVIVAFCPTPVHFRSTAGPTMRQVLFADGVVELVVEREFRILAEKQAIGELLEKPREPTE